MKPHALYSLIAAALWLTSCTTGQREISPSVTATFMPPSPTPAYTPTLAPSPTPSPTPVVMENRLIFVADDELHAVNIDDLVEKVIVPKQRFDIVFPVQGAGSPIRSSKISPDGKKIAVWACGMIELICKNPTLYLGVIDNLDNVVALPGNAGTFLLWSPASDRVLINGSEGSFSKDVVSLSDADFGKITHLPDSSAAFWSYNGSQVYYFNSGWYIVNNDGSNSVPVKCDICSGAPDPSTYAVAQSPDGKSVAIGYQLGTVIIASADLMNYKMAVLGSMVNSLYWSPDGTKLAISTQLGVGKSEVMIVGADGTVIGKLSRPKEVNEMHMCEWLPNSQAVVYTAPLAQGYAIYLQVLDEPQPVRLKTIMNDVENCPVWLPASP